MAKQRQESPNKLGPDVAKTAVRVMREAIDA